MGRKPRNLTAGDAAHIWARGNRQETIFGSDAESRMFLSILLGTCAQYDVAIAAYCLMTNHYHLVVTGRRDKAISKAIGRINQEFTNFQNRRAGTTGQNWQGRFGSKKLDESHFWAALCYVERNPVMAGIVLDAADWPWSSARTHLGLAHEPYLDCEKWNQRYNPATWRQALQIGLFASALEERKALGQFPGAKHPGKVLVPERGHRVDPARPPGGQKARAHRNGQ